MRSEEQVVFASLALGCCLTVLNSAQSNTGGWSEGTRECYLIWQKTQLCHFMFLYFCSGRRNRKSKHNFKCERCSNHCWLNGGSQMDSHSINTVYILFMALFAEALEEDVKFISSRRLHIEMNPWSAYHHIVESWNVSCDWWSECIIHLCLFMYDTSDLYSTRHMSASNTTDRVALCTLRPHSSTFLVFSLSYSSAVCVFRRSCCHHYNVVNWTSSHQRWCWMLNRKGRINEKFSHACMQTSFLSFFLIFSYFCSFYSFYSRIANSLRCVHIFFLLCVCVCDTELICCHILISNAWTNIYIWQMT